jgi:hypothetical protein
MSENSLDLQAMRGRVGLARAVSPAAQRSTPLESATDEDECPAFGYLRGIRDRALALELRFANGNSQAFPYSWLGPIRYDPSAGLLLTFVGDLIYLVLLEGSNLNALVNNSVSLYDRGILRHRVTWVREMSRAERERAAEREVTIERIHLVRHRPDEEPKAVAWLEPFKDNLEPST